MSIDAGERYLVIFIALLIHIVHPCFPSPPPFTPTHTHTHTHTPLQPEGPEQEAKERKRMESSGTTDKLFPSEDLLLSEGTKKFTTLCQEAERRKNRKQLKRQVRSLEAKLLSTKIENTKLAEELLSLTKQTAGKDSDATEPALEEQD